MPAITTPRLILRPYEKPDTLRFVELLNEWDVTKWMSRVPYPYTLKDAEWWCDHVTEECRTGVSEFHIIEDKTANALMGVIGYHLASVEKPDPAERVIGYWLGKPYWGKGYMSEAVAATLPLAFERPDIKKISSFTEVENTASQNVLRKAGLRYLGIGPRVEINQLRGGAEVTRWEMTREEYFRLNR